MIHYSRKVKEKKPVRGHDGRIIAYIFNSTLLKYVIGSRHKLKRPEGWACDTCAIEQAQDNNVKTVLVIDKETGQRYSTAIEDFMEYCVLIDRGYGEQLVLELPFWEVNKR
jgi:hypothetical protein